MPVPPTPKDPTYDNQVFPSKKVDPSPVKLPSAPPPSAPPAPPPAFPPKERPTTVSEEEKPRPPWMVVPPTLSETKAGVPLAPEPSPPPSPEETAVGLVKESPFKKIVPAFLGILVILLLFFVVKRFLWPLIRGGGGPQVKKQITLTYWGLWEESSIMTEVIKDYQTENSHVSINYVYQSPKDYRERLQSAFARGEEPDIFRFHNTWRPMLKKELAPVPSTVFSQEEFKNTFYPVAFEDLSSQGEIYGIPLMFDSLALFYNPALLEAAGKTVPETWDELRTTAKEITVYDDENKIQTSGVALGTGENVEHFSDILGLMILQNGADPAYPTNQLTQDALTFYTLFRTRDHVWDQTLPNSIYAFAIEKVAMIFAPSWQVFTIKDINPNLNFKTAKVPQLPDNQVSWATYWAEGVSSQSENQEEAFAFLKYLSTPTVMRKFYNQAAKTRLFGELYSRVDQAYELEDDAISGAFIQQAPKAKSWYLASRTYDNGLNDRLIKYYQDAINSLVQGESSTQVFETLESGTSQVLSQYGL